MRLSYSTAAMAGALLLGLAVGEATAHVTANPDQAPADSWFRTALRVSHGCGGTPTVTVRVKLPDGVLSVRPQMKPGSALPIGRPSRLKRSRQPRMRPARHASGRLARALHAEGVAARGGKLIVKRDRFSSRKTNTDTAFFRTMAQLISHLAAPGAAERNRRRATTDHASGSRDGEERSSAHEECHTATLQQHR